MLAGDMQSSARGTLLPSKRDAGDLQTAAGSITGGLDLQDVSPSFTCLDWGVLVSALVGDLQTAAGNMTAGLGRGVVVKALVGDLQTAAGNMTAGLDWEVVVSAPVGDRHTAAGNMTAGLDCGVVASALIDDLQTSAGNMTGRLGWEHAVPKFAVGVQTSPGSARACPIRDAMGSMGGFALGVASTPIAGTLELWVSHFSAEAVRLQLPMFIQVPGDAKHRRSSQSQEARSLSKSQEAR